MSRITQILLAGDRVTHPEYGVGTIEYFDLNKEEVVVRLVESKQMRRVNKCHLFEYNSCAQENWERRHGTNRRYSQNWKEILREEKTLRDEARRQERKRREQKQAEEERLHREAIEREQKKFEKEQKQLERERRERASLLQKIWQLLRSDFLGTRGYFLTLDNDLVSLDDFEKEKINFLREWFSENAGNAKFTPDDEQLAAIGAVNGNIKVTARAGSGKTATLVNRAFFLIKNCGVAPNELLMLAFNKKAVVEIRKRLLIMLFPPAECEIGKENVKHKKNDRKYTKPLDREQSVLDAVADRYDITLPHILTFHALAYAIVHPEETLLYDDPNGEQGLGRSFQAVIDEFLRNPTQHEKVRQVMLASFRNDWERIGEGGYDLTRDDFLRFRRSLPFRGLDGRTYKSHGEKILANFLFEHDVKYYYEDTFWWDGIPYCPDFKLPLNNTKSGVIIEYFGMTGDAGYDKTSEEKRGYWKKEKAWTLIDFEPCDITDDGFKVRLKTLLEKHGIYCIRLSEEEIWERAKERAIDYFTQAMSQFVGKCRQQMWSPDDLRTNINTHAFLPELDMESGFLELAHDLYIAYLQRLESDNEDDFNGLMERAVTAINGGKTAFARKSGGGDLAALRYICIDEFQDFSELFYQMISAIRKHNPAVELFGVGDDWQAINGFAGSDLRFFSNFEKYIGATQELHISKNYRSSSAIVNTGNVLMEGLGKPAVAHQAMSSRVLWADIDQLTLSTMESNKHAHYDKLTPAVLRVVAKAIKCGLDVVLLSRKNTVQGSKEKDKYLRTIREFFPQDDRECITISTVHKYKGLQKSVVIVLDAVAKNYPLIHPSWIFFRIFDDNPEKIIADERRLFYVALTRAVEALVIFTEGGNKSPFLQELEERETVKDIDWREFPPLSVEDVCLVKISNQKDSGGSPTYKIKDFLKELNYSWIEGKWCKEFPTQRCLIDSLKSEKWADRAAGVEVQIFEANEIDIVAHYEVDNGNWRCVSDNLSKYQ